MIYTRKIGGAEVRWDSASIFWVSNIPVMASDGEEIVHVLFDVFDGLNMIKHD